MELDQRPHQSSKSSEVEILKIFLPHVSQQQTGEIVIIDAIDKWSRATAWQIQEGVSQNPKQTLVDF